MTADVLNSKLSRIRREIGCDFTVRLRVTRKRITFQSISSKHDDFSDEEESAGVAALKRLNKSNLGKKPNYIG